MQAGFSAPAQYGIMDELGLSYSQVYFQLYLIQNLIPSLCMISLWMTDLLCYGLKAGLFAISDKFPDWTVMFDGKLCQFQYSVFGSIFSASCLSYSSC